MSCLPHNYLEFLNSPIPMILGIKIPCKDLYFNNYENILNLDDLKNRFKTN